MAGDKMKTTGTAYWYENTGAINSSGFSALPGGLRYPDFSFAGIRWSAWFWSATEIGSSYAWSRYLYYLGGNVVRYNDLKKSVGASVRCLRD